MDDLLILLTFIIALLSVWVVAIATYTAGYDDAIKDKRKMAKNNALLSVQKMYHQKFNEMIPKIYASMVLAMKVKLDLDFDTTAEILSLSQDLWEQVEQLHDGGQVILDKCKEMTGIDIMYGLSHDSESGWTSNDEG